MSAETAAAYCDAKALDAGALERATRLAELKTRLQREVPERCDIYTARWDHERQRVDGLESWGRMVQEKLRGAFEKEFADETVVPELNWHQAETEALESFIEDHARGFVARTDVL